MRLLTSQKGAYNNQIDSTMQQNNSVSNLDGDGHRSDFTFVLSQPTQGGFTECHNCGVANGSIILDNVNGSILQSHGLRSSIGDTSMQIRKKVLTNYYTNQGSGFTHPSQALPNAGGTASFPDGILGVNSSISQLQSAKSSEPRVLQPSEVTDRPSQKQGLRNRLPEIAASPIYSESGGVPGRKFFMSMHQAGRSAKEGLPPYARPGAVLSADQTSVGGDSQRKTTQLICSNGQDQGLRLSQIQGGVPENMSQAMQSQQEPTSPTECARPYHRHVNNFMQAKPEMMSPQNQGYYENGVEQTQEQQQPFYGQSEPQSLQDLFLLQQNELTQSRQLLLCTFDFLQRFLQQGQGDHDMQEEAVRILQAIQAATMAQVVGEENMPHASPDGNDFNYNQPYPVPYAQIPEAVEYDEEEQDHLQDIHNPNTDQNGHEEESPSRNQMTESEIMDGAEAQDDDQNENKVFLLPKQLAKTRHSAQNILAQSAETRQAMQEDQRAQLDIKQLESHKNGTMMMKNSLLSSAVQDNTLYDLDKDTVYSFFAEESEIRPRAKQTQFGGGRGTVQDGHKERASIDGQTSFIASQSPKQRRNQTYIERGNAGFAANNVGEDEDLAKTQRQLKAERRINQEQSDMLKQMQAQINALTYKWSITENQLKNNGAIYSVLNPSGTGAPLTQASVWHPTATSVTQNPAQNLKAHFSVLGGATNTTLHQQLADKQKSTLSEITSLPLNSPQLPLQTPQTVGFASPFTQTTQTASLQAGFIQPQLMPQHLNHNLSTGTILGATNLVTPHSTNQSMHQQSASVSQLQPLSSEAMQPLQQQQYPLHAADQSKHLIELNKQLREQIETNTNILEHMQTEQTHQQQQQQNWVQSRQTLQNTNAAQLASANQSLGSIEQTSQNAENVQSLITLTKIAAEATIQAHSQHKQEMERLRKRQLEFTAKIDKIGTKLSTTKLQEYSVKTKVGLKSNIRQASFKQGTIDSAAVVQEGDGQDNDNNSSVGDGADMSSTVLDMTSDKVPTKDSD